MLQAHRVQQAPKAHKVLPEPQGHQVLPAPMVPMANPVQPDQLVHKDPQVPQAPSVPPALKALPVPPLPSPVQSELQELKEPPALKVPKVSQGLLVRQEQRGRKDQAVLQAPQGQTVKMALRDQVVPKELRGLLELAVYREGRELRERVGLPVHLAVLGLRGQQV